MIPAYYLDPRAERTLAEYLCSEIEQALRERKDLEDTWTRQERAYRAKPEEEQKQFPFVGAANLVIPVIATDVDTIYSQMMGMLFASDNVWTARPLNDVMVDYAPRIQEFLQWAQDAELGVYDAAADWCLELCKLGTAILKQRYTRETKKVYQWRETDQGLIEQHLRLLWKDHPTVEHVALIDFLLPAASRSIQLAPWCAERLRLTWGQLQNRIRAGIYRDSDNLARWWAKDNVSNYDKTREELDQYRPSFGDRFEIWEGWLDFDVSGTGDPCAVVATMHLPTKTVLRVDFNPFFNQEKPYSAARYLRQDKRFYGIGLCEMLEQFQEEVSAMHNQRLDNATLANSSMFKARKNIGIKQNEPVFPGRWFLLDNLEDVAPMPMGQRYDSTIQNESLTMTYASQRTGKNDYITGDATAAVGYATATTNVQQYREARKRMDQVMREVRTCWGEAGTRVLELYQQFNQHGKEFLAMGPTEGQLVHAVLQFPLDLIRASVGVELTATSEKLNKDIQIRTDTIIMQMLMQYYQQVMMALSYAMNEQLPPVIRQTAVEMVQGGSKLMKRIMENYGEQDSDQLIPQIAQATQGNDAALQQLFTLATGRQGVSAAVDPSIRLGGGTPGDPGTPQINPAPTYGGPRLDQSSPYAGGVPSAPMGYGAPPTAVGG